MERYASKVLAVAKAEVGYLEKKTNSNLDSKTGNAGYNNYTKYARDLDKLGYFYNGPKNGYPYCDVFVDWCFVQAYGVDDALDLLCQPKKSYGAGCEYSARYYKNKGQFHKKNPKVGDQIFFWNSKKTEAGHTGLVTKVDSTYVYAREGNTSGASGVIANGGGVCDKKYKLNDPDIYGYGRPNYDPEPEEEKPMKKVYVNPGHSDTDPGAVGYEIERELAVKVSNYQRDHLLENYRCEVRMNPGTMDKLLAIATDANNWGADLFCSNHFNAGKGDGYEALVHNEKRRELGEIFEKHVKAAGQNSRGVKLRPNLAVLRLTDMPAILNEGAFVDNRTDIEDWNDEAELKCLGIAYAEACAEFLNLERKTAQEAPVPAENISVQLPVLRRGDEGLAVKAMQTMLNGKKYPCGAVDGEFGQATEKAVKTFQEKQNLPVTGIVDADTWQAIWKE